jgi:hypothetical protein
MTSTGMAGFGVATVALVLAMRWLGEPAVDASAAAAPAAASRLGSDAAVRTDAALPSTSIAANPFGGSLAAAPVPAARATTGATASEAEGGSAAFGNAATQQPAAPRSSAAPAAPAAPVFTATASSSQDPEPDN